MKTPSTQTHQERLKTLAIVHLALAAGPLLLGIVTFIVNRSTKISMETSGDPFLIMVPLLAVAGFSASIYVFKQKTGELQGKATLPEKVDGYLAASLIRYAMIEAPALFGAVAYLKSGNFLFLLISLALILYLLSLRPTKEKLENDLELPPEQKM